MTYFLSQRLCTAAASSGSGSAAKDRPIPKCSIATLSTVSLPLHGTMMQIFRPSDGDPPMTTRNDHHSDYGPSQLVLFGMAVFVLLVFTWTYVH
jgi:hypothetical protein